MTNTSAMVGWRLALALLALWACLPGLAQSLQPIPTLTARVTDTTGTLSAETRAHLEARLAAFEKEKGAQVAVLMVATTEPEPIEMYSIRVVEQWKLGRAKIGDGALLIIAKDDRRMRIEVGRGLEGALTDATSKRITRDTIVPMFRNNAYDAGVAAGVEAILKVVGGEALPPPEQTASDERGGAGADWFAIAVLAFIIATFLARPMKAMVGTGGALIGAGLVDGVLGYAMGGSLVIGAIAAAIGLFAVMSSGAGGGRRWASSRHGRGFPSSGGWGGGFGGGGGFGSGGFSGGGGDFGGGGASDSW